MAITIKIVISIFNFYLNFIYKGCSLSVTRSVVYINVELNTRITGDKSTPMI